jgi:hypothetical protein
LLMSHQNHKPWRVRKTRQIRITMAPLQRF